MLVTGRRFLLILWSGVWHKIWKGTRSDTKNTNEKKRSSLTFFKKQRRRWWKDYKGGMSVRHCHGWRPQTLQLSDGSLPLPLDNPFSIFTLFPFSPFFHFHPCHTITFPHLITLGPLFSFSLGHSPFQLFTLFIQVHNNLLLFSLSHMITFPFSLSLLFSFFTWPLENHSLAGVQL